MSGQVGWMKGWPLSTGTPIIVSHIHRADRTRP
jgi:hypothetical protein